MQAITLILAILTTLTTLYYRRQSVVWKQSANETEAKLISLQSRFSTAEEFAKHNSDMASNLYMDRVIELRQEITRLQSGV